MSASATVCVLERRHHCLVGLHWWVTGPVACYNCVRAGGVNDPWTCSAGEGDDVTKRWDCIAAQALREPVAPPLLLRHVS